MIVDASPIVALGLNETSAPIIAHILAIPGPKWMSAATLTEISIVRFRRAGISPQQSYRDVLAMDIEIVPVTVSQSIVAAEARVKFPIRFGDAFVYALAKERNLPILTLDAEFAKTDAALVPLEN
ncbi:PIN domain-containing protein [bacterium]|nr:MAG: PIN domain-containing protein [bacterium]